jgi:hypothetical protein
MIHNDFLFKNCKEKKQKPVVVLTVSQEVGKG